MLEDIFDKVYNNLVAGAHENRTAYRYGSLSSVDDQMTPHQRTVVLRGIDKDMKAVIYSDKRSPKIAQIATNSRVSLLFYDHENLTQTILYGTAALEKDQEKLQVIWSRIQKKASRDYTTLNPPGTKITNPDQVGYDYEQPHFAAINIQADSIQYLQLKRPNHIRAKFDRLTDNTWNKTFLVP